MKNELLFGIGGLVIGAIISGAIVLNMNMSALEQSTHTTSMNQDDHAHDDHSNDSHSMSMDDMVHELEGKSGDAFDKAFIEQMIPHHEGAVDMAKLAQQNAAHQEIKDMAEEIITAQEKEIKMMQDWQMQWGY